MLFDVRPLARTRIQRFSLNYNFLLRDISPLAGLPLTDVDIGDSQVADIRPLANLKLVSLKITHRDLANIAMLKGMPLESLCLESSCLSDLSPLAGMKLKVLHGAQGAGDLSILKGMPLKELDVSFRLYFPPDERLLRSLPLEKVNEMPVATFWADVEKRRQADQAFVDSTANLTPEKAAEAVRAEIQNRWNIHPPAVKTVGGVVVEAAVSQNLNGGDFLASFRAFPGLRKLILDLGPNAGSATCRRSWRCRWRNCRSLRRE